MKLFFHVKFTCFSQAFQEILMAEFSLVFHRKNTMNIAWKSHEKSMKSPQYSTLEGPRKNSNKQKNPWKCHEIKWSQPCFVHGFLIIMKKPRIEKLFFMVSEFMGFSWGFFKFMPHKKTMSFPRTLEYYWFLKNKKGFWWHFHYPWIKLLAYFLWERQRHLWPPWKFSLKLFSTVKSDTSLRICWLVNLKLCTCSNNPNTK